MDIAAHLHPRIAWPHFRLSRFARRCVNAGGLVLLAGVMIGIWFVGQNWPFRYRKIHPLLEDVFGSQIHIAHYRRNYFPHPGFIATGLTLRPRTGPGEHSIGTIGTLYVQANWIDIFCLRDRLRLVEATGMHIILPPPGSRQAQQDYPSGSGSSFTGPTAVIEQLFIHASTLEIQRKNGKRLTFPVHWLRVWNLHRGAPMTFAVNMDNPLPYGHLLASGSFGPLNPRAIQETPVSGWFKFEDVKLSDVGELKGILDSTGSFHGQLGAIDATAQAKVRGFAVKNGNEIPVSGSIQCTVNGMNGDVVYHAMEARTGSSLVQATGSTAGTPGKATRLDLVVRQGRAEEILRPFIRKPVPIAGAAALHAHVDLDPTQPDHGFLDRLHVTGAFDIPAEEVTKPDLRKSLSAFSLRAQDKKVPDSVKDLPGPAAGAISSLQGPVTIEKGIARTPDLRFEVPGAQARLSGTFNFRTTAVHLTGKLTTHADLSDITSGFKSVLLEAIDPLFRHHRKHGAVIPVALTGTTDHYKVTQNFGHKK
ncbi:MAG TPA: AsmA-like C-terminal region-containing protein [Terracidiphilus sp.]|nr:AsmA-like C-terminal region-containing protein [Terracidiphilus sp.]